MGHRRLKRRRKSWRHFSRSLLIWNKTIIPMLTWQSLVFAKMILKETAPRLFLEFHPCASSSEPKMNDERKRADKLTIAKYVLGAPWKATRSLRRRSSIEAKQWQTDHNDSSLQPLR